MWLMCKMQLAQMFGCLARVRVDSGNDAMVCVVAWLWQEVSRLVSAVECFGKRLYGLQYQSAFEIFELVFIELIGSMAIVRNLMIGNGGVEAKGLWLKAKSKILKLASEPRWKKVASVRWTAEHAIVASNNIMTQGLSNAPKEHACCADAGSMAIVRNSTIGNCGVEAKGPWLKAKSKILKLASEPRWKKGVARRSMVIFRNSTIGNGGVEAKGPWLKAKSKILNYLAMVVYHVGDMVAAIMQQHNELIINERCLGLDHPNTAHRYMA
ncbi:hypothetical protein Tco_1053047 [Tanacetum coccineum]